MPIYFKGTAASWSLWHVPAPVMVTIIKPEHVITLGFFYEKLTKQIRPNALPKLSSFSYLDGFQKLFDSIYFSISSLKDFIRKYKSKSKERRKIMWNPTKQCNVWDANCKRSSLQISLNHTYSDMSMIIVRTNFFS